MSVFEHKLKIYFFPTVFHLAQVYLKKHLFKFPFIPNRVNAQSASLKIINNFECVCIIVCIFKNRSSKQASASLSISHNWEKKTCNFPNLSDSCYLLNSKLFANSVLERAPGSNSF